MGPGRVACLRRGTYRRNLKLTRGGTSEQRAVLRSAPGHRVRIVGRLVVGRSANHVTIRDLSLNGRNRKRLPSPTVNATGTTFLHNDVTNRNTAICFVLGSTGYGEARETALLANRIHHCGTLPASNHDHGIYVEEATDTLIAGNWIYDNADRGVQLYPNAQRTRVIQNVIHRNGSGVIFSGDRGLASNDNLVEGNAISDSTQRYNVESYYPDGNPEGSNNLVRRNCIAGGARNSVDGGILHPQRGFDLSDNLRRHPRPIRPRRGDLRPRDPICRKLVGGGGPRPGPRR